MHELLVLCWFSGLVTDVLDAPKKLANNDEGTAFTVSLECKYFWRKCLSDLGLVLLSDIRKRIWFSIYYSRATQIDLCYSRSWSIVSFDMLPKHFQKQMQYWSCRLSQEEIPLFTICHTVNVCKVFLVDCFHCIFRVSTQIIVCNYRIEKILCMLWAFNDLLGHLFCNSKYFR